MTPRETAWFVAAVILGPPLLLAALPWLVWFVAVYAALLGGI
jgi:hypothetical protein